MTLAHAEDQIINAWLKSSDQAFTHGVSCDAMDDRWRSLFGYF
jgi:hypothetical protein